MRVQGKDGKEMKGMYRLSFPPVHKETDEHLIYKQNLSIVDKILHSWFMSVYL